MSKQIFTIENITAKVKPLAQKYHVKEVYLFGSYARGDNSESSDIDFRIEKGRVKGLQMAFLHDELEDALHRPVDLLSTGALNEAFLASIRKEEKLLYEQS